MILPVILILLMASPYDWNFFERDFKQNKINKFLLLVPYKNLIVGSFGQCFIFTGSEIIFTGSKINFIGSINE